MKNLLFALLSLTLLCSCEKEDGLNEGACCMFTSVSPSDLPAFKYRYTMIGNAVYSGDQVTRNQGTVYSNTVFQLNVYLLGPLSAQDSIVH